MEDIYHAVYEKLDRMGIFSVRQYTVIERPPYTALCIDRLEDSVYALPRTLLSMAMLWLILTLRSGCSMRRGSQSRSASRTGREEEWSIQTGDGRPEDQD